MAIGDDATEAGYPLVPDSGDSGRVRWGSREINRTRDFIAQLKKYVDERRWPISQGGTGANSKSGARTNIGIRSGTANPSGGENGDIYFKIV